jgi:hypothetical protein
MKTNKAVADAGLWIASVLRTAGHEAFADHMPREVMPEERTGD